MARILLIKNRTSLKTPYPLCQKGRRRSPAAFDVSGSGEGIAQFRIAGPDGQKSPCAAGKKPKLFIAQPQDLFMAHCLHINRRNT